MARTGPPPPPRHYSAPRHWNRMDWERRFCILLSAVVYSRPSCVQASTTVDTFAMHCVGAIDGLAVEIAKPRLKDVPNPMQ